MEYKQKYLKYKNKYLILKKQMGGMMRYHSSNEVFKYKIDNKVNYPTLALFNVNDYPINYDPTKEPSIIQSDKHIVTFRYPTIDPIYTDKFFGHYKYKFNYQPLSLEIQIENDKTKNFLSDIVGSLLGLTNDDTEIKRILIDIKEIIIVDFANCIGVIMKKLRYYSIPPDKIVYIIKNYFKTFLNKINKNSDLMCIIVAKPLGGINITTIVNEFIKEVKVEDNFFTEKCIIIDTYYYNRLTGVEKIISGGVDDFILWVLTISLQNLAIFFNSTVKLLTNDEQQIYKNRGIDKKTILTDIFPEEGISIGIKILKLEKDSITEIINNHLNNNIYILLGLFLRETVTYISNDYDLKEETKPLYLIKSYWLIDILDICNTYYNNDIYKRINALKDPKNMLPSYKILPLCFPKLIDDKLFIMPNCLKLIYYIRMMQIIMYGNEESSYSYDEIIRILTI